MLEQIIFWAFRELFQVFIILMSIRFYLQFSDSERTEAGVQGAGRQAEVAGIVPATGSWRSAASGGPGPTPAAT